MVSLDLCEVAEILRTDEGLLERLLEARPGALPGAVKGAGGWRLPERALRALLLAPTGPLPAMATVAEVAEFARRDIKTVYRWLRMRDADGEPVLPHQRIMGQILIPARAVMDLPRRIPGPPSLFFASKSKAQEVTHG
jgi:hypothetical protein